MMIYFGSNPIVTDHYGKPPLALTHQGSMKKILGTRAFEREVLICLFAFCLCHKGTRIIIKQEAQPSN